MVVARGHKYKGGRPEEFRSRPLSLRRAAKGLNWIHGPLGQNRVAQHHGLKNPSLRKQPGYSGHMFGYSGHVFGHPIDNPDTPGIRSDTLDIYSDMRSTTQILF